MDETLDIETNAINYVRALAAADDFLGSADISPAAGELPALLAAWAAEGERLAYPTPALDPERRTAR